MKNPAEARRDRRPVFPEPTPADVFLVTLLIAWAFLIGWLAYTGLGVMGFQ